MKSLKGISDVIAVVLMIAVAISIGVFVTTFATKWVQDQTSSPSITCAIKTNYVVDDAKFNFTGKSELLVKTTNKGDQDLYGFGFVLDNVTTILSFNSSNPLIGTQIPPSTPLKREQSTLITLNLSNSTLGHPSLGKTLAKITLTNDACKAVSASITSITVY